MRYSTRPLSLFESFSREASPIFFGMLLMVLLPCRATASVSLLDVVRTALHQAPGVQLQRENLRSSESDVLAARSAFDPQVSLSLGYRHDAFSSLSGSELKSVTSTLSSSTLLPFGLIIRPELSVVGYTPSGSLSSSQASSGITFTLPLMEGLGENSSFKALSAYRKVYQAENCSLQHTASSAIYGAARAYWNYLYAYRALKLDQQLRDKAEESFSATKALAGAGEIAMIRPDQAKAYLQQAAVAELSSSQSLRQAWSALFRAMGTSIAGRENPEEPVDLFPVPGGDLSLLDSVSALKAQAFSSRSDLQALRLQSDAANDLLAGSRNRMKPKIDIDLWAGYRGQHKGSAIADYLSSIASEVPGLNVSATLRYMFATGNYSDEAALIRSRSLYEKSLISYLEMERSISGSVGLAAEAVKNTTDVYWLSMQSASTYRLLHAAELKKYRLGISDLFKTQAISTDLAHAEKQLLAVEQAYATSLLTLRYEIAALVHVQDGSYSVEQQDLVTLPLLNNTSNKP